MDVTLVLTHRCNLNCGYCYAGEHHKTDMDPETASRGVEFLFADDADTVQLGFFGGEPLLAFDTMVAATETARTRCTERNRDLVVQCTTNASAIRERHVAFFARHQVAVTVSIDGVREAHDLNRPKAGGGSSFGDVHAGLAQLLEAGLAPDAMMVITPQTVPYVYQSVSWLWTEGVQTVRANLSLDAPWGAQERDELREQLTSIGIELAGRRLRGETVRFVPFEPGMRRVMVAPPTVRRSQKRQQVVVGVGGNLYPCAPMVGEDRDTGPEVALRIGHLSDGPNALLQKLSARGAGCSNGGKCACAAYLETGDRDKAGPIGLWYAALCREIGAASADAIINGLRQSEPPAHKRRPFLLGMAAAGTGLAVGVPVMIRSGLFSDEKSKGCQLPPDDVTIAGVMMAEPPPEPEPERMVPGGISAPEPIAPEPKPRSERPAVRGDIGQPRAQVDGGIGPASDPLMSID